MIADGDCFIDFVGDGDPLPACEELFCDGSFSFDSLYMSASLNTFHYDCKYCLTSALLEKSNFFCW